jgi:hypothetical protein
MREKVDGVSSAQNGRHVGEDQRRATRVDLWFCDRDRGATIGDRRLAAAINPALVVTVPDRAAPSDRTVEMDISPCAVTGQSTTESKGRLKDD